VTRRTVYVAAIQFPYDDIQFPYDDKVHPAPCELRWLGAVSEWDGKAKGHMWLAPPRGAANASRRGQPKQPSWRSSSRRFSPGETETLANFVKQNLDG